MYGFAARPFLRLEKPPSAPPTSAEPSCWPIKVPAVAACPMASAIVSEPIPPLLKALSTAPTIPNSMLVYEAESGTENP